MSALLLVPHSSAPVELQPGSLRVRVGDRVRRGQVLARLGNSCLY